MADLFTYNGTTISTPRVDIIDAEAVYDEGHTSVMFTKSVLRVQGTIQGTSASDFAAQLLAARTNLMVPRGALQVQMGGTDLFNITADDHDDNGGPKPKKCTFTEIVGALFCVVVFEIEVCLFEKCATLANGSGGLLSHSYSVTHSIDERCYTTRIVRGKYRVALMGASTGSNRPNFADSIRQLFSPTIPTNFKRVRADFLLDYDGLGMTYEFVDEERYRTPPACAVRASGKFSHQMDNFVWFNHLSLEFEGAGNKSGGIPSQSPSDMCDAIFLYAAARIDFTKELVTHAVLEEDLFENIVRLQMTSRVIQLTGGTQGIYPQNSKIFNALPGDSNTPADFGVYGTALLAAGITGTTGYFDPCAEFPVRYAKASPPAGFSDSTPSAIQPDSITTISNANDKMSSSQLANPYVHWENYLAYEQPNGNLLIPSTKPGGTSKIYQFHTPYQIVRQTGYAIRMNVPVEVPKPQSFQGGQVVYKRISPGAPQLQPTKQAYEFSASWEYEIQVPLATSAGSDGVVDETTPAALQHPTNAATKFLPSQNTLTVTAPIVVTP